jgi:hypothetical protein
MYGPFRFCVFLRTLLVTFGVGRVGLHPSFLHGALAGATRGQWKAAAVEPPSVPLFGQQSSGEHQLFFVDC